jgi:hypothetical protein
MVDGADKRARRLTLTPAGLCRVPPFQRGGEPTQTSSICRLGKAPIGCAPT